MRGAHIAHLLVTKEEARVSLCDEGLCFFLLLLTSYRSESQKVQKFIEKVLRRAKKRLESRTTLQNQKHSA